MTKALRYQIIGMCIAYMLYMGWLHIEALDFYFSDTPKMLFGDDAHTFWRWLCEDVLDEHHDRYQSEGRGALFIAFILNYLFGIILMSASLAAIWFERVGWLRFTLLLGLLLAFFLPSHPWILVLLLFGASISEDGLWWGKHH